MFSDTVHVFGDQILYRRYIHPQTYINRFVYIPDRHAIARTWARRGTPGCNTSVEIPAQRRRQTSPKVAQLIVSFEFTVTRSGRFGELLLNACRT